MDTYHHSAKFTFFPKCFIFITVHLLALLGLFLFPPTWTLFAVFAVLAFLTACFGITISFHRNLTHRAFDFRHKTMERLFATFGTLAMEQGPIWWTSIHRLHHRYSDRDPDPHNSKLGFWYSHFKWLFHLDPRWERPDKIEKFGDFAKDIAADPYHRFLDRFYYLPTLVVLAGLYLIGGWAWVFWGGFIRQAYVWHVTWFVNSVTHRWGYRNFTPAINDSSTNNWWVGLLAFGEGWHNNHHAFPSSPKNGFFRWWEFDLSYIIIMTMYYLGLVTNLRHVPKPTEEARRIENVAPART